MPGESQQTPLSAPDPTVMTTEQLDRAVSGLEKTVAAQLAGFREIVQLQFDLIADWRLEQKDDTRVRLDAAFAAQKEAIAKQEGATDRQLEQLRITFSNAFDELRRAIEELKASTIASGAQKQGGDQARVAMYSFAAFLTSLLVIGGFVAAIWPR